MSQRGYALVFSRKVSTPRSITCRLRTGPVLTGLARSGEGAGLRQFFPEKCRLRGQSRARSHGTSRDPGLLSARGSFLLIKDHGTATHSMTWPWGRSRCCCHGALVMGRFVGLTVTVSGITGLLVTVTEYDPALGKVTLLMSWDRCHGPVVAGRPDRPVRVEDFPASSGNILGVTWLEHVFS